MANYISQLLSLLARTPPGVKFGQVAGLRVGEDAHLKGADGVRRAKRWLESTMRVSTSFTNVESDSTKRKLCYTWPHGGQSFSYDLGGMLRGAEFASDTFSAEVKLYLKPQDQGIEYREFLARSYAAVAGGSQFCDHLLWITWCPFSITSWHELRTPECVRAAVLEHRARLFDTKDEQAAAAQVDEEIVKAVADRLWIVVLSDKQEKLVPLAEWVGIVNQYISGKEMGEL